MRRAVPGRRRFTPCYIRDEEPVKPRVLSPLPSETLLSSDLPKSWDIRNVSGVNYMTQMRQQHLPVYCGGCYSVAPASSLNDRISLLRRGQWPEVVLSPQYLISCKQGGNGCHGGSAAGTFELISKIGVPLETCNPYRAIDNTTLCVPCAACLSPTGTPGQCRNVTEPAMFGVSEFGDVAGEDSIMKEIYARGPVACGIAVTDKFEDYAGGIYSERNKDASINRITEIHIHMT